MGVTFDPHFKCNAHIKSLVTQALPNIIILKAHTGTNWGQEKETILITYNSLIRSLSLYTAPIWFLNGSPSLIQNLQTIQNSALRIATGCVRITCIDHLHEETKMLPVQDYRSLISFQYLARALQPNNPSHSVVTFPSGIINIKHRIYGVVFYPSLIMEPPSSHFIPKLFSMLNLFFLITLSFGLLPHK